MVDYITFQHLGSFLSQEKYKPFTLPFPYGIWVHKPFVDICRNFIYIYIYFSLKPWIFLKQVLCGRIDGQTDREELSQGQCFTNSWLPPLWWNTAQTHHCALAARRLTCWCQICTPSPLCSGGIRREMFTCYASLQCAVWPRAMWDNRAFTFRFVESYWDICRVGFRLQPSCFTVTAGDVPHTNYGKRSEIMCRGVGNS